MTEQEKQQIALKANDTCMEFAMYATKITHAKQNRNITKEQFLNDAVREFGNSNHFDFRTGLIDYVYSQPVGESFEEKDKISADNMMNTYSACMQTILIAEGVIEE